MAPLNPSIQPTNEPKYGQDSRAIDTPDPIRVQGVQQNQILPKGQEIGDRSAEYLGQAQAYGMQAEAAGDKAWGDLFSNIVGIGDFLGKAGVHVVNKEIENRVYEVANREREDFTAELEKIKAGGLRNIMDANASADMPGEIQDLPDTLGALVSARDGGKITKTDYQGRLLAEAKRLRAQFPGFKQKIDDEFAKVTGQNPANAKLNSLVQDINRAAASNNSAQNRILTYIRQNGDVPRADEYYAKFLSGQMTEYEVVSKISQYNQAKENIKLRGLVRQDVKETREEGERRGRADFDYAAGVVVAASADRLQGMLGLNTPEDVERMATMQQNGQIAPKKWEDLNTAVNNEIASMKIRMTADADRTGTTRLMGGKKQVNEAIAEAIKPLEEIQKAIISRDVGGLYSAQREAKLILDQGKLDMLKDHRAGPAWVLANNIRELGGENYLKDFQLKQALGKNGLPEITKDWFNRYSAKMEAQRPQDPVATFNDFVDDMRKKKEFSDPKVQAKAVGDIVTKVEKIADPKVPDNIKISIMKSAFSDGNNNFLSKLNVDGVDQNGRPVKGMNAVYQKWTSPEVTAEVYRLGKTDPQLITNYENWAQKTFANELSPNEINKLSDIRNPDIKIGWDAANKRFEPRYFVKQGNETELPRYGNTAGGLGHKTRPEQDTEWGIVQASINRLNGNIYNLKKIAEASGRGGDDIDTFILKTIADASGGSLRDITGLPQQMIYNMALGRQKKTQ